MNCFIEEDRGTWGCGEEGHLHTLVSALLGGLEGTGTPVEMSPLPLCFLSTLRCWRHCAFCKSQVGDKGKLPLFKQAVQTLLKASLKGGPKTGIADFARFIILVIVDGLFSNKPRIPDSAFDRNTYSCGLQLLETHPSHSS